MACVNKLAGVSQYSSSPQFHTKNRAFFLPKKNTFASIPKGLFVPEMVNKPQKHAIHIVDIPPSPSPPSRTRSSRTKSRSFKPPSTSSPTRRRSLMVMTSRPSCVSWVRELLLFQKKKRKEQKEKIVSPSPFPRPFVPATPFNSVSRINNA